MDGPSRHMPNVVTPHLRDLAMGPQLVLIAWFDALGDSHPCPLAETPGIGGRGRVPQSNKDRVHVLNRLACNWRDPATSHLIESLSGEGQILKQRFEVRGLIDQRADDARSVGRSDHLQKSYPRSEGPGRYWSLTASYVWCTFGGTDLRQRRTMSRSCHLGDFSVP